MERPGKRIRDQVVRPQVQFSTLVFASAFTAFATLEDTDDIKIDKTFPDWLRTSVAVLAELWRGSRDGRAARGFFPRQPASFAFRRLIADCTLPRRPRGHPDSHRFRGDSSLPEFSARDMVVVVSSCPALPSHCADALQEMRATTRSQLRAFCWW